ncbi:SDR family oxidoreductase [Aeromicrobium sp. CF3.5]|uniref:SDR family oxidoreductase n=1 Tax=Aeromicrobium sp. CF3.5 TaxID=3373078 RepID=UPI003EE5687C
MSPATIAVVGARGKTGRAVTDALHRRGASARPIGRAELRDPVSALRGCEAVYLIAPNLHPDEPAFVAGILDAAARAGTSRIVYHSVVSPHAPSMPHHLGKAVSEDLVRRSSLSWTLLQPSCYLQNVVPALSAAPPALRVPYSTTQPFSFVDLLDVAEAAATIVVADGHGGGAHHGATYELGGTERTTIGDLARVAEAILGTPVPAERIDPAAWSAAQRTATGDDRLDDRQVSWLSSMFDYYDRHGLLCGAVPLTALLGRQPTTVEATLRREL